MRNFTILLSEVDPLLSHIKALSRVIMFNNYMECILGNNNAIETKLQKQLVNIDDTHPPIMPYFNGKKSAAYFYLSLVFATLFKYRTTHIRQI